MSILRPTPPPYDPLTWERLPLEPRARQVCQAWALQGYGTPVAVVGAYGVKILLYVAAWCGWCAFTPGLGDVRTIGDWWLSPIAFQKAIVWSMLFEGIGLGCGSGPLTGRYAPPVGGFLHFLRPGTIKLPVAWLPVPGGTRRTWLDVACYGALLVLCVRALIAAEPAAHHWIPIAALVPMFFLLDRTIFLALRAEHYWVTIVCFAFAADQDAWIAGAMAVQLALWAWAGLSKLNHHFPSVVCVMTSNGPLRPAWLRRRMYRAYPDDLRPSRLAVAMAHMGTALELGVPLAFVLAGGDRDGLMIALALMLGLHVFITSNVPMGVPLEWNVMVAYGGFALFWAHPGVGLASVAPVALGAFLAAMLVVVPLAGNLWPHRVSFLLAMRYYAGNWPFGVWLFRGDSFRKLDRLTKCAPWVHDQLARFYDRGTAVGLVGKVIGFRLMHLQGRILPALVPRAIDRLEDHEWVDGELVAGLALGWNFGDGHLHHEQLLAAIQARCAFEPGELRCIFVESQPLGRRTLAYRIHDAATGLVERGEVDVTTLRARQPWSASG
jgi:hypothetical protein